LRGKAGERWNVSGAVVAVTVAELMHVSKTWWGFVALS